MICAQCGGPTKVTDSRPYGSGTRRRRVCACGHRFTTWETPSRPAKPATGPETVDLKRAERAAQARRRRARMAEEAKAALRLRRKLKWAGINPNSASP